jgi:hypothetical protein
MTTPDPTIADLTTPDPAPDLLGIDHIHRLTPLRAVLVAIKECKTKRGPERLIKYLAPTGGGKSVLAHHLQREHNARVVEAREAWRTSYATFLLDIARALRLPLGGEHRPAALELKIRETLRPQPVILVIDEGEYFGARALNGLKWLLNQTRIIPVLCAIPAAHDKWDRWHALEAAQLRRRTNALIELAAIKREDAAHFFPAGQFADPENALKYIVETASTFGHYSHLQRLADHLRGETSATADTVKKACAAIHRQMHRAE